MRFGGFHSISERRFVPEGALRLSATSFIFLLSQSLCLLCCRFFSKRQGTLRWRAPYRDGARMEQVKHDHDGGN
jgi:hypothetical protein